MAVPPGMTEGIAVLTVDHAIQGEMDNTRSGVVIELDHGNSVQLVGVNSYALSADNLVIDDQDTYMAWLPRTRRSLKPEPAGAVMRDPVFRS